MGGRMNIARVNVQVNTHTCTCTSLSVNLQQDYQTYVSRKAQKRQSLIVSLSDYNQQELRDIQRQKEELIRDYEEKRAGVSKLIYTAEATSCSPLIAIICIHSSSLHALLLSMTSTFSQD